MKDWTLSYEKRCVDFFFKSIDELKSQSGGQRWNAICEDTVCLFFDKYPKELGENPFSRERIWQLLFEGKPTQKQELYIPFLQLSERVEFVSFLFFLLQALLDPPNEWWKKQFI